MKESVRVEEERRWKSKDIVKKPRASNWTVRRDEESETHRKAVQQ